MNGQPPPVPEKPSLEANVRNVFFILIIIKINYIKYNKTALNCYHLLIAK